MGTGMILRLVMVLTGVVLMGATLLSLARRKMTESFALTWGMIGAAFIFSGVNLRPVERNRYLSGAGLTLMGTIGFCMIFGAYFMSVRVSELMRRNLELAMQMALVKQELEELKKQEEDAMERSRKEETLS